MTDFPYRKFSRYLREKYGCRVYKIPVNVPGTCPNRDGTKGTGGCIFCGEEAAAFESFDEDVPIGYQLSQNISYMGKKYRAEKFIAYFQNHSNTYMDSSIFRDHMIQACMDDIAAIYISTRPDCINEEHAGFLRELSYKMNIDVLVEMGLQSADDRSLELLNRCHTAGDYADASEMLVRYGIPFCAHVINDLPFEKKEQVSRTARFLNETGTSQVKCHSLYVLDGTKLGEMYKKGEITMLTDRDFIERTILFLRNLSPDTVVQRLMGRAPKERTLFCNYGRSWRAVVDEIVGMMMENNLRQGDLL